MNNYSMPMPYSQPQAPQIRPEVNAVKIELINPQAYGAPEQQYHAPVAPMMYQAPAPLYAYPQAQIYPTMTDPSLATSPLAPVPFLPQQPLMAIEKKDSEMKVEAKSSAPEPPLANFVPTQPAEKQNIPVAIVDQTPAQAPEKSQIAAVASTSAPAPVSAPSVAAAPSPAPAIELPKSEETKPAFDVKPIVGSLKSENLDEQFSAIQMIAEIGQSPKAPSDLLLHEDVFNGLKDVINKDTSSMPGPSAEQIDLRNKKFSGEKLSAEQDSLAETLAPKEVAEMNKQYATYTLAVVQKNFRDSVNQEASKQGLEPVRLNEIPEMETVVENIKSNPSPLIREASISALTYVAKPEDKDTVGVILSAAATDSDPMVQETAKKAQEKVNNLI